MKRKNVLFLYTSLAAYFIECCKVLATNANVNIIHWKAKGSAPYQFELSNDIKLFKRESLDFDSIIELIDDLSPDVIVCSGWVDQVYLKVCKRFFKKIPTVVIVDNHWNRSPKQILATLLSPFFLRNKFSHVWIPGSPQYLYAKKLGFTEGNILEGYYAANVLLFNNKFKLNEAKPKRFLFLGRYVELKGIFDLWEAFHSYRKNGGKWELWCAGTGEQWKNRPEIEGLNHFGFLQQNEMDKLLKGSWVYILPSHFEPWAVSVHEMAAAGFPLLLSRNVGAATKFLKEGENGYYFNSKQPNEIEVLMHQIEAKSEIELLEMGKISNQLANTWTPKDWAQTISAL